MTLDLAYFTLILYIIIAHYCILEFVWFDVDHGGV